MSPEDKLKGVIRRVAESRGHDLMPWRLYRMGRHENAPREWHAMCRRCGRPFGPPGMDVRAIPQCPTLFGQGKEG